MVTILLERRKFIRATHVSSADLFLGDSGRIEILSESCRQFTSVDIRLRDSRGQNLAADTNSCERLYQAPIRPYFSERPT